MSPTATINDTPPASGINGLHPKPAALRPGIYAPIPTFFYPDTEELDHETLAKHITRLAQEGVAPVVLGSMGEVSHLLHAERTAVIRTAADALAAAGLTDTLPLIAGCGAGSTIETVALCREAKDAGAGAVMVLSPGYFVGALDREALRSFYVEVAEKSPLPLVLYNYPGAAAGIDLDSDFILDIMDSCPNAVGVKLTCGAVGKLSRLAAHPRSTSNGGDFHILNGFIDHLLPSASLRTAGAITGLANVIPKSCVRLYQLSTAATARGGLASPKALEEAIKLQGVVSHGDWVMAKRGVAGTKYMLQQLWGYGGNPRRPLLPFKTERWPELQKEMETVLASENSQ